jgi:ribosome-binding protein aMBF1 (putative translation factor)
MQTQLSTAGVEAARSITHHDEGGRRVAMASPEYTWRIRSELQRQERPIAYLARRLGKSQSTVSRWLSGEHNITAANLKRIAEILGVSVAWLMGEDRNGGRSSRPTVITVPIAVLSGTVMCALTKGLLDGPPAKLIGM